MENASKALIIAGAILISILLISVGIMVMNSAQTVTGTMEGQMDAAAIQSFNAKFENYAGSKKGSVIKTLISEVSASNAAYPDNQITVTWGSTTDLSTIQSTIRSTTTYTVTLTKDATSGLVTGITITGGTAPTTGAPASSTPTV